MMRTTAITATALLLLSLAFAPRTNRTDPAQTPDTAPATVASGADETYAWDAYPQQVRVWNAYASPTTIRGRYNAAAASATNWEFELAPGESDTSPPGQLITSVTIYADSATATYGEDFALWGW